MKELRDQTAHCMAAIFGLALAALWPNPLTFGFAGFCMGMAREVTEEGEPVSLSTIKAALGSRLDLTFWTLGGALAGFLT